MSYMKCSVKKRKEDKSISSNSPDRTPNVVPSQVSLLLDCFQGITGFWILDLTTDDTDGHGLKTRNEPQIAQMGADSLSNSEP